MPRAEQMNWQPRQRRWIKKYRGKQHVVSCRQLGTEATREASRARANEWWEAKRRELDRSHFEASGSRAAWDALTTELEVEAAAAKRNDNLAQVATLQIEQAAVARLRAGMAELPLDVCDDENAAPFDRLYEAQCESAPLSAALDRLASLNARRLSGLLGLLKSAEGRVSGAGDLLTSSAPRRRSLRESIDKFLSEKMAQVNSGKRTAGRYDTLNRAMQHFANWFVVSTEKATAGDIDVNEIDGNTLPDFLSRLESQRVTKEWSDCFTFDLFAAVKQYVQWAYMREHLNSLPRNFHDRALKVTISRKKPQALPVPVAKQLLSVKDERSCLYFLLALNCGMTQVDIADLLNSEVDWQNGRIIRKRSKTSECENVPVVNYRLWAKTFELLVKHRSADTAPNARLLVNRNAGPLKYEIWREKQYLRGKQKGNVVLGPDGKPVMKLHKSDAIRNALYRAINKLKLSPAPSFKQLRKCGVTTLKGMGIDTELRNEYLGHSVRTIRERDYEGASPEFQARFDAAIAALGRQIGQ